MNSINFVREKLKIQEVVYGVWSIIPSPILAEVIAFSKLDFQIFDLEHGAYDISTLEISIRNCENAGCSPFVRIAGLDPYTTQKALDFGAHGIIYPQIKNLKDAKKTIDLTKYHPIGSRGFNPFTRVQGFSLNLNNENLRNVNGFSFNSLIIENESSAKDLENILELKDVEIIYLGAYDMSVALGRPGDMENPELIKFMESSIKLIHKKNKIAGVMAQTKEQADRYVDLGARFVVIGVDSYLIGKTFMNIHKSYTSKI
jgi:4-hydroxy-2-oxoheptanedioate aldolase